MADIRAFRGFRYDLGRVGSLGAVVAPPYDVVDAAAQQRLYDASPYNAVRVELTRDEPGDGADDKYTRAARALNGWVADGALRQDTARSLYVYEQEFTADGATHTRRGFLARVRLEPPGTGRIFPHEQTLAGPKADRLKLYRATGFNVSPVFGLYPDAAGEVVARFDAVVRRSPPTVATDPLGVVNRLWAVTDTAAVSAVIGLMGPKPVFIADGHHRYETGLKYLDERRAAGEVLDDEAAPNFCLMMLVGMSDPGLLILPTHRLVGGLPPVTADALEAALTTATVLLEGGGRDAVPSGDTTVPGPFEVVGRFEDAAACWEHVQLEDTPSALGFGTAADGKWLAVKLTDPAVMDALAPHRSAAWRGLAVSVLHKVVLEQLVRHTFGREPACRYVHRLDEVTDAVAAKACQVACLVPPCTMADVGTIAGNRETMPPKSTYFYPKLLTGMVLNSLKRD